MSITGKVAKAKAWWKSKTIIGVIISFIPTGAKLIFDVDFNATEAVDIITEGAEQTAIALDSIYEIGLELFGMILAIYGRLKSTVKIKGVE